MSNRRNFIKKTSIGLAGTMVGSSLFSCNLKNNNAMNIPLVISTWKHGFDANEKAYQVIKNNGSAIDAVEEGVKVSEADPNCHSVGYGGWPDRDGNVTLDACIMDHTGNCGSVSFLQNIKHPISVARKVMDETPHVMLSGEGALQFALKNGFHKEDLLTDKAKQLFRLCGPPRLSRLKLMLLKGYGRQLRPQMTGPNLPNPFRTSVLLVSACALKYCLQTGRGW